MAPDAETKVPARALLLSALALGVPVLASTLFPAWTNDDVGVLLWLTALVPPFLMTYYKGWQGASLALAAGMATVVTAQVVVNLMGAPAPRAEFLLGVVIVLIFVSLAVGWLSELLHRARREAEAMALTDGLTGLPNRRHARLFLSTGFASAQRGTPLSVVIFDLDEFKAVNDRWGHVEGDRVLVRFAEVLEARTRDMNLSARFGGEEFLSILSGAGRAGAVSFAEDVRKAFALESFGWGHVTVSAGVAAYENSMANPEVLVAAADQALYRAKEEGRDRVVAARKRGPATASRLEAPEEEDIGEEMEDIPRGQGEAVLVVDDDRDARRSIARALSRFGYHPLEADGPRSALEIVRGREEPLQLLLVDVIMPDMSGFRLVEILSRWRPDLRVVYMSGFDQAQVDWAGVPGSVRSFLSKPITVEDLARVVRRVLDASPQTDDIDLPEMEPTASPGEAEAPAPSSEVRSTQTSATEPEPERALPEDVTDARILVVDDEQVQVNLVERMLHRFGYHHVKTTTDPREVQALFESFQPDLVLLDLRMPGMDGFEVMESLQPLIPDGSFLPIVVVTGHVEPEVRRQALSAGGIDFLTKPFEISEVEARIRNLLQVRFLNRRLGIYAGRLEDRVAARTAELEEARTEILLRLARAAEYRDDLTGVHAERVGLLAGLLAELLGVEEEERDRLQRAAPLHDVGKIGVPDAILRKPGPLSEDEFRIMRDHAPIGAEILSGSAVDVLRTAEEIALRHHERWDGSGYPDGLEGTEIPRSARIVAVADVYDSLTHDRPYRRGLPSETAISHLEDARGVLYEAAIVDALLELRSNGRLQEVEELEIVARPTKDALQAD